jgi:hypothetical protein
MIVTQIATILVRAASNNFANIFLIWPFHFKNLRLDVGQRGSLLYATKAAGKKKVMVFSVCQKISGRNTSSI